MNLSETNIEEVNVKRRENIYSIILEHKDEKKVVFKFTPDEFSKFVMNQGKIYYGLQKFLDN